MGVPVSSRRMNSGGSLASTEQGVIHLAPLSNLFYATKVVEYFRQGHVLMLSTCRDQPVFPGDRHAIVKRIAELDLSEGNFVTRKPSNVAVEFHQAIAKIVDADAVRLYRTRQLLHQSVLDIFCGVRANETSYGVVKLFLGVIHANNDGFPAIFQGFGQSAWEGGEKRRAKMSSGVNGPDDF